MTPDTNAQKAALRSKVRTVLAGLAPATKAEASASVCQHLLGSNWWRSANAVLLFAPLNDEPDIWPLVSAGLAGQKLVGLPKFDARTGNYVARRILDPEREIEAGKYGIREPCAACPQLELTEFDLILVPGLAFDRRGHRLGRGRGYYDRWLVKLMSPEKLCGVALAQQIMEEVPCDTGDIAMGRLLTPSGLSVLKQ